MPEQVEWFPERAWGGRVWVPATARAEGPEGALELFGHVSYVLPEDGEPADFRAGADFTDVLAEDNRGWRIDLNDEVIGRWRGENGREGAVTLVWGRPLVRGAVAATAELDAETVDQEVVSDERFTLIALDALKGYGDDIFMQVKLWSRRAQELAARASTPEAREAVAERFAQFPHLRAQLGELPLDRSRRSSARRGASAGAAVALLARVAGDSAPPSARTARQAFGVVALDQLLQRRVHGGEVGEAVQAPGPLLQLARRLRAAQHQHCQQRQFGLVGVERLVEQVAVLARAAAGTAGEPGPAAQGGAAQRLDHGRLVVVDNRVAVGRLVAGEPQSVERQGVGVGSRALLLQQAPRHPDLDRVRVHRAECYSPRALKEPGRRGSRRSAPASRRSRSRSAPT